MDDKEFEKYLKERYEKQIEWYDKKAVKNQKAYKIFQWGVIVLSAITPVLVAIGSTLFERYVAVIVSFLVAAGTTLLKTFKYQENWINYRTTCETLKKERYYYNAKIADYKDRSDPKSIFVKRVEAMISRENTYWLAEQKREEITDENKENQ